MRCRSWLTEAQKKQPLLQPVLGYPKLDAPPLDRAGTVMAQTRTLL